MKILIDIDAGPVNCDGCHLLIEAKHGYICDIFYVASDGPYNMPRPPECLAAEKAAKGEV
jgi:hypothetical protein